jgi:hypothetical protein
VEVTVTSGAWTVGEYVSRSSLSMNLIKEEYVAIMKKRKEAHFDEQNFVKRNSNT